MVPAPTYMVERQSPPRSSRMAIIPAVYIALLAGGCAEERPSFEQQIQVYVSAPVVGADVYLWWVDGDGHPLRKDGRRHATAGLDWSTAIVTGGTDDSGSVVLDDADFVFGTFVLASRGGSYMDPWLLAGGSSTMEATVSLAQFGEELTLWSVVTDYVPPARASAHGMEPAPFVISPMTTLAKAMAERPMEMGEPGLAGSSARSGLWYETMRDSFTLLGAHLGDTDLTRGPLPDWLPGMPNQTGQPGLNDGGPPPGLPGPDSDVTLPAFDEQARRGLILAAFPSLARQMALAADVPVHSFHTRHLLALLLEDAADPLGLLDGIGPMGQLMAGVCAPPDECAGQESDVATCRAVCTLDSNTLRADLASALAFDFLGSPLDRTGLTLADIISTVEYLRLSQEARLFGYAPPIELGGPRPIVRVLPTTVYDEIDDTIVFDERGVPVHTAGDLQVDLGGPGAGDTTCPLLHKFTHRLDHADDNAIRWQFEIVDQRGAAIEPDAGMYRLRLREGAPGEPGQDIGPWLTDWRPAQALDSVADGVRYEVVLLRSQIPVLGIVSGEIEIELRGADEIGLETEPVRYCWEHVPLAPPLQVRNVVEAVGAGSLHATNLEPGNNLAPLLNGVPLEQGRAVMDLEIVNGTAEPVYVTFTIEQGLATFTKSWQKTNAFLFFAGGSDCLGTGDCTFSFPPDRRTVVATDEAGIIERLVSGTLVQDMTTGQLISPCESCDPDEYRVEPRVSLANPRVYRIQLVVTDLRVLAPQPIGEPFVPFTDAPLDAEVLPNIVITGQTFGRVRSCTSAMIPTYCGAERVYRHYVSLTEAALFLAGGVHLVARSSPSPQLPAVILPAQSGVLGPPVGIEAYQWSTAEEPLPLPMPEVNEP